RRQARRATPRGDPRLPRRGLDGLQRAALSPPDTWLEGPGLRDQGPISLQPRPSPWSFEVTPYLWTAGLTGDLSARGRSATVDPSFSDLLKDLDFGAMLLAEARYDRWGLLLDGFYLKLSKDAETPGPLFSSVDATSQMGMIGPSLAYRAVLTDRFTLDVLGGARIWFVDTELDFKPSLLPGGEGRPEQIVGGSDHRAPARGGAG